MIYVTVTPDDRLATIGRQLSEEPGNVAPEDVVDAVVDAGAGRREELSDLLRSSIELDQGDCEAIAAGLVHRLQNGTPNLAVTSHALAVLASERPMAVVRTIPSVVDYFGSDDHLTERNLLWVLVLVGREQPEPLIDHREGIATAIRDVPLARSTLATEVVRPIADADPSAALDLLPALLSTIRTDDNRQALPGSDVPIGGDDGPHHEVEPARLERQEATKTRRRARRKTADTIATLVSDRPEEAAAFGSELADALTAADDDIVASALLEAVAAVAETRPEPVVEAVGPAGERLVESDASDEQTRSVRVLALLAESVPTRVTEAARLGIGTLFDLLEEGDPVARRNAAALLSYLAEHEPDMVGQERSRLLARLDDEDPAVRASTAWILAFVGGEDAEKQIAALAENDSVEVVRTAAQTALRIVGNRE